MGSVTHVDVGIVNDHVFVHHVTLGLHPGMLMLRKRLDYESRLGKLFASAQAFGMALRQRQTLHARIEIGRERLERITAAVLVSNNPLGQGHLPYADDLRQGQLGLYIAKAWKWQELVALAGQVLLGGAPRSPLLEHRFAERFDIWPAQEQTVASVDGELVALRAPLRFALHQRGLAVLRKESGGDS